MLRDRWGESVWLGRIIAIVVLLVCVLSLLLPSIDMMRALPWLLGGLAVSILL
jgi:hypothetical protein